MSLEALPRRFAIRGIPSPLALLLIVAAGLSLAAPGAGQGEGPSAAPVGPTPAASPASLQVAGAWLIHSRGIPDRSTCRVPPPKLPTAAVRLSQDGATVPITLREEPGGACVAVPGMLAGNVLTYAGKQTARMVGCVAHVERSGRLTITGSRMSGTEELSYRAQSGDCGLLGPPCVWAFAVEAERCSDCWRGCVP